MALMPFDVGAVSGGGGLSDNLSGTDQSGKDLRKVKLTKANLRATNFDRANLTGVSLFSALAEKATFRNATMVLSDLESGNFEDADFTGANLTSAFVNNAQFKNAIIKDTDWPLPCKKHITGHGTRHSRHKMKRHGAVTCRAVRPA